MNSNNWSSKLLYDNFMGKWSRLIAQKFLLWLRETNNVNTKSWLDVGCGTGALTYEIANNFSPSHILGLDPSPEYLPNNTMQDIIEFMVGNSSQIPVNGEIYDYVVSGLALNFMDDKAASIGEMKRVLKHTGCLALYVWDYSGQMEFLRIFWDAAGEIKPEAKKLDEGVQFPVCKKPALIKLFTESQLKEIKLTELIIDTKFKDIEDYWKPFLGGQGPAGSFLISLNESDRKLIKYKIMKHLGISKDEPINLKARAYAIQGKKL